MDALTGAPWLRAAARVFEEAGAPLYAVGGAVRNPLMDLPLSDVDVCGTALPEAVMAFCEGTAVRANLRAAHFGTVELFVRDDAGQSHMAEYTTFREDSYRCGHRPEAVRFTTDIAVDALRRDFSVNALYQRVYPDRLGEVIDPTGGLKHMQEGVLHTVTKNPDQVLKDDGLRILRAARFQAELGLEPTPALMESLTRYAPLLQDIAHERLRDEWQKTLMADLRYPMLKRVEPATQSGLRTLGAIGAWPWLFPEIELDEAAARALSAFGGTQAERMALLLRTCLPSCVESAMTRLHFSAKETACAKRLVQTYQALLADELSPFDAARAGDDALSFAQATASVDENGKTAATRAEALLHRLQGVPRSLRELAVGGDDLKPFFEAQHISLSHMGETLTWLWRLTAEHQRPNERNALLGAAREWLEMEGWRR